MINMYTATVLTYVLAVTAAAFLPTKKELISTLEEDINSLLFELTNSELVQEHTGRWMY